MSIHPVTSDDAKKLQPLIDSVRSSLAVHQIRVIGEERRDVLRERNISDNRDRMRVSFARYFHKLGLDHLPLPDDDFLTPEVEGIYNAILGTTRDVRKVSR